MKKEFENLADKIWGISKKEAAKLEREYKTIEGVIKALKINSINFLKESDLEKLKRYFEFDKKLEDISKEVSIIEEKKKDNSNICPTCKRVIPKDADRGICPNCKRRRVFNK